jgi:hypothetical protein
MAITVDIADAVVAELNDASFSREFTAVRSYRPQYDLAEMSTLHVTVVPKAVVIAAVTRSGVQYDVSVDVAVQQHLESEDAAAIDPLMDLVEEIADFFRLNPLSACPNVSWVKTENHPVYSPQHLEEFRQFTSVLMLTFLVVR